MHRSARARILLLLTALGGLAVADLACVDDGDHRQGGPDAADGGAGAGGGSAGDRGGAGRPCLLDADCAAGHGCVLGVCTRGCDDAEDCGGQACDPHGWCGGPGASVPGPLVSAAPEVTTPALRTPAGGVATVRVHNPGGDPLVARLTFPVGTAQVDPEPFIVEPGGTLALPVQLAPGLVGGEALGTLWTEHGSTPVPVLLQTEVSGRWEGLVQLDDGRPLGRSSLGVELRFDTDGTVVGRTIPEASLMWPRAIAVTGSWDEVSGKVTLELEDVVPASFDGDPASRNPLARELGRRIVLRGHLDDEQQVLEGTTREQVVGLRAAPVVVAGSFRLRRSAAPSGPLDLPPPADPAVAPQPWPETDQDPCDGLGDSFGRVEDIGAGRLEDCRDCVDGLCSMTERDECVEALLGDGYQIEQTIPIGDLSVTVSDPFAAPQGWVDCFGAADQSYPCLDDQSLRCASELRRQGWDASPDAARALGVLDALEKQLTAAALVGTGHVVDAGLAYTEHVPLDVAAAEQAALEAASAALVEPARYALAPANLEVLDALGGSVLRDQRGGRDLAASLRVATLLTEVATTRLRLQRRRQPGQLATLREAAAWTSVWTHLWGALLSDLHDAYAVTDELGELAVFDRSVGELEALWRELRPDHNPLGFSPAHVPILLSAQGAHQAASNYELLAARADQGVAHFEGAANRARQAVDAYQSSAYDAEQRAAAVRDEFDAQLVGLCGADPEVPTRPNLVSCGESGGEIQGLRQRIEGAEIRVRQAHAGLEANLQAIEVENERMARRLENAAELDLTVAGLEEELLVVVLEDGRRQALLSGARARAECAHLSRMNAANTAHSLARAFVDASASLLQPGEAATALPGALVDIAANRVKTELQCEHTVRNAGFDQQASMGSALTQHRSMIISNEINDAVRASQIADQIIDSEAHVKRMMLSNEQLGLDIEAAEHDLVIAGTQLASAFELAASILSRRERALARLTFDPRNPYLNPSFLLIRNELGRRLAADRERALRQSYRAARALEYEINRELPLIETGLFPARAPSELGEVGACLDEIFVRHQLAYGAPQTHVTELSVRRDVFGITGPIEDPVTGYQVSEAEQFQAVLAQPGNLLPDGSLTFTITIPVAGAGAQTAEVFCNDRIEGLQLQAVGDFLGDGQMVAVVGRKGGSYLRRCDAASLPEAERVATYALDDRQVAVQAGVNDWGHAPANAGLAGWPVAGDQWVFTIPAGDLAPENADAELGKMTDFLLRITHRAGTVAEDGSVTFTPSCG